VSCLRLNFAHALSQILTDYTNVMLVEGLNRVIVELLPLMAPLSIPLVTGG
jgi:hypothetical protein